MDTFVLHVRRQTGFTSAAIATKVIIDGSTMARLNVGGGKDFTLPRKPVNITLLSQVSMGGQSQGLDSFWGIFLSTIVH